MLGENAAAATSAAVEEQFAPTRALPADHVATPTNACVARRAGHRRTNFGGRNLVVVVVVFCNINTAKFISDIAVLVLW